MSDRQFYALVLIHEWGEESRERRIGPFYAPDADTLAERLQDQGDEVVRIEEARP